MTLKLVKHAMVASLEKVIAKHSSINSDNDVYLKILNGYMWPLEVHIQNREFEVNDIT
jgi:hypothetical protein